MSGRSRFTLFASIVVLLIASATRAYSTTIAPVKVRDLFATADQVALVKILSGDSEHYSIAVYKAIVESAFKGTIQGQIIFIGPFTGYALGNEYVVFLKRGRGAMQRSPDPLSYGSIPIVSMVMYDGYASLAVGYECVFDGPDIARQCDYSVQLNPEQVVLPERIRTFPVGDATPTTNYKKWVRKKAFLSLLHP